MVKRGSEGPQLDVDWWSEQFKLTNAEVVRQVTVGVRLHDPECWKSLGINLLDIISDRPALTAKVYSLVVSLVQYDPFLHVVWCLELPALHTPHSCVTEWIGFRNKSASFQWNSDELLRFIVCYAGLILVGIRYDESGSTRKQRTAKWFYEF